MFLEFCCFSFLSFVIVCIICVLSAHWAFILFQRSTSPINVIVTLANLLILCNYCGKNLIQLRCKSTVTQHVIWMRFRFLCNEIQFPCNQQNKSDFCSFGKTQRQSSFFFVNFNERHWQIKLYWILIFGRNLVAQYGCHS